MNDMKGHIELSAWYDIVKNDIINILVYKN